ncbi:MAG: hypothetical protein QXM68_02600 [Candidatus Aenigmatarchaeota archaeon]|nr:hypothetical protein [Candidatus Aenigmarchaeota archaeon]
MLIFCPACGNIMTLKEKRQKMGVYECRRCGGIKKLKAVPFERKESIVNTAPPVPL